jgi:hypothetical protein
VQPCEVRAFFTSAGPTLRPIQRPRFRSGSPTPLLRLSAAANIAGGGVTRHDKCPIKRGHLQARVPEVQRRQELLKFRGRKVGSPQNYTAVAAKGRRGGSAQLEFDELQARSRLADEVSIVRGVPNDIDRTLRSSVGLGRSSQTRATTV